MSNEPIRALRADNRIWDQLRSSTQREYQHSAQRYVDEALKAGFDPKRPPVDDLLAYFDRIENERGPTVLHRLAAALVHYFQNEGLPVVTDHPVIVAVLRQARRRYMGLENDDPKSVRAQWFASHAYRPATAAQYIHAAMRYVSYADSNDFDPRYPSVQQVKQYLVSVRESYAASTVKNYANGISFYLREQQVPDIVRSTQIKEHLKGVKRDATPTPTTPLYVEDALTIVEGYDLRLPLDIRDALLISIVASAGLPYRTISRLDRSRSQETPNGVMFSTDIGDFFVSRSPHPELDVVTLLKKWTAIVGTEPGPLFARLVKRGAYGGVLSINAISEIVHSAIARLERPEGQRLVLTSFRKGFDRRSTRANGELLTAQATGYGSSRAMRHFVPNAGRDVQLALQRRWKGAPTTPRRRRSR
jgi:hypothetical protein